MWTIFSLPFSGVEDFLAECLELRQRSGLVIEYEAAVADNIGRQYRRKPSLDALLGHWPLPDAR